MGTLASTWRTKDKLGTRVQVIGGGDEHHFSFFLIFSQLQVYKYLYCLVSRSAKGIFLEFLGVAGNFT